VARSGIPEDVRRFIIEHIGSMDQLELLFLLHGSSPRAWSAEAAARELRIEEDMASRRFADLEAHGLAKSTRDSSGRLYCYSAASAELDRAVGELVRVYAERKVAVIDLIFSKPLENIRVFADAFRLRKDDEDG